MENFSPYEFIAAFAAVAVAVIGGLTLHLNHSLASRKHYIEKKLRIQDFLLKRKNKYPLKHYEQGYLRNLIFDFCNKKTTCTKLFMICINRPDSEHAIESFYTSGHLFYYCSGRGKVIRKSGGYKSDIFKAIMLFVYYASLIFTLWLMITYIPSRIELETRTQIYTYLLIFAFLIGVTGHSMISLGTGGKRMRANRTLANILVIKEHHLPK